MMFPLVMSTVFGGLGLSGTEPPPLAQSSSHQERPAMPVRRPLMRPPEIYVNGPEDLLRHPEPAVVPHQPPQQRPAARERRPLMRPPEIYVSGPDDLLPPGELTPRTEPRPDSEAPAASMFPSCEQRPDAPGPARGDRVEPVKRDPEST